MTPRIICSASTSAAVAKSPAPLSTRLSRWPYMSRTTCAPARAPAIATAASSDLAYESSMPCRLSRRTCRPANQPGQSTTGQGGRCHSRRSAGTAETTEGSAAGPAVARPPGGRRDDVRDGEAGDGGVVFTGVCRTSPTRSRNGSRGSRRPVRRVQQFGYGWVCGFVVLRAAVPADDVPVPCASLCA